MSRDNSMIANTVERLMNGDDRNLEINRTPVQIAGQDQILRRYSLGGGDRDIRMFLSQADLEYLLEIAKRSPTRRVCLPSAGVELTVMRSHGGHQYETLKLISREPIAERAPSGIGMAPQTRSEWEMRKRRG